jgi:hypothetical protein
LASPPQAEQTARLSNDVTVRAAWSGNRWISLSDGHDVITSYVGPANLITELERNEVRPLSLVSADFDEDGVPDLISGYAASGGSGVVTLHRGNVDSICCSLKPEVSYLRSPLKTLEVNSINSLSTTQQWVNYEELIYRE